MHSFGDEEISRPPASRSFLCQLDLGIAQGLAMSRGGVLFIGRAESDMAFDHDEGRPIVTLAEIFQRAIEARLVIGVGDMQNIPAVGRKPFADIF